MRFANYIIVVIVRNHLMKVASWEVMSREFTPKKNLAKKISKKKIKKR